MSTALLIIAALALTNAVRLTCQRAAVAAFSGRYTVRRAKPVTRILVSF